MNPPSMESIFLILSGAILLAGILYWFWSHIKLTQMKVQLVENAVFELGNKIKSLQLHPPAVASVVAPVVMAAEPEEKPYNDLGDDDWEPESNVKEVVAQVSTPLESIMAPTTATTVSTNVNPVIESYPMLTVVEREEPDDLQPGGRIHFGEEEESKKEEAFRELFINTDGTATLSTTASRQSGDSLDSMPLKELRRLAEQRGIRGASEMRKKEILGALRNQVSTTLDTLIEPVVEEEKAETVEAEVLE